MMRKSITGSTCLNLLEKFKTLSPHKEVLDGADSTLKLGNILPIIDGLEKDQEYLHFTQQYVDHYILEPWNVRQDVFVTCIPTSENDTVDGLDILSALSALAYEVDDMACLEEIADQYQHHAGVGYLMSNLGVMFSERMDHKKSETCFAMAKNCFEHEHDHLGNAVACLNLAILHKLIGNDENARSYCDSAASLCRDIFMRMTRDVYLPWKVLRRVVDLFQEFGNYKRCQDILRIGVLYDISGANEVSTINLMKKLMALQLKEQNGEKIESEELEDVASQLLELLDQLCTDTKVKQELSADLITTAIILARMYRDINQLEEACRLLKKLEAKYLLVHGRTHCLYASLLYHVGRFKLGAGKAGEAENMLKHALESFVYYFGKDHHMVASCKSLLGTCALLKGHSRDAFIFLNEALSLFKKMNPCHPEVAEILLKFAFLRSEEGNLQRAEMNMQEALDIFISVCGEDSPKTASAYFQAAAVLQKARGSRASAVDKVKKAIDLFLKLGLQCDHPDVMICHSLLGVLQLNMGRDEAQEQFNEVQRQVSLLEEPCVASKIISPESTNMFFQVKTSGGAERYSCFGATVIYLVNLVHMKAGKERRAHLSTLLGFLQENETEIPLIVNFAGHSCMLHKVWPSDRYVYCVLTDQGVNSDSTSLESDNLKDPNVFLLSSSTGHGKKPCYLLFWKTPKLMEMEEPRRVLSAFRESVTMLFLQPKFRKGYIDGQDFYTELMLPTEPHAMTSLYSQIDYLPLLVEQLSVTHKDGNIDTALHSSLISAVEPSIHISYFSYRFSTHRQAEFVFDNLICSLGQSFALTKMEGVAISNASAVENGEFFSILEPSNSCLSLIVEEESVLVKCWTVKEYESSCICSSLKNTLESTMDSLCCVVRVTFEQSLQLFCGDHDLGCNFIKESAKKPSCSGQSSETLELHGDVRSEELVCEHLERKPHADLLQNEVEEDIVFTGQPGDKISTEVCLGLLDCLLTSRHVLSEVEPSGSGEMSSGTHSGYLDDEKLLNKSMLSPGSMSSLNSYPTSPSNEVCEMPVLLCNMSPSLNKAAANPVDKKKDYNNDDMTEITSAACAVCNELPLNLQEKQSNQSVGDNSVGESSAMRSSHEEGVSSGENNQDTERETVQLEDGTQLSKEEILILKSEVEFCQNQCHELRQQLSQLKEQFQQCEEEKQQLELELGRRSFLEDKQKRNKKAFWSSRTHANKQSKSFSASGASYAFTDMQGRLLGGAGPLQEPGFSLQQRLLEISNSLSDVELRQMKLLAKPRVNGFRLAKIREGFELFEELDANGVLSCTCVRELLTGIQRFDLLEKLDAPLLGNAERGDGAFCVEEDPVHEPIDSAFCVEDDPINKLKDGAFFMEEIPGPEPTDSTFCMEGDPEHEPRSHPPTGQTTSDRTTESSVIPPRENSLDLLPENPSPNTSGDNLLQLQSSYEEGLATAEGDPLTETRETDPLEDQLRPQLCHPTDGELRGGVDSLHQHNIRKSDSKGKRMFLSAKNDDDVVRLITTAVERDSQERIERLQRELQEYETKKQILQSDLKRTSVPVAKQIGRENIFQLSKERTEGVASRVEKDLPGGAVSLPGARSHPPTGQKMLDRITESSVIPPEENSLDLLSERHDGGCDGTFNGMHIQGNEGGSGINEAGPVFNMSCGNSVNSGSDMVVLPMNSDSEDSFVHPRFPDSSNGVNSGSDMVVLPMNSDSEDSSVHTRFPASSNVVSFSSESSSTTVSSSELPVSSAAEPMRVESTSSSWTAHSVCDGSPRVTLGHLSAVKNHERFSDTSSYYQTSSKEEILESTLSSACEGGDMDRREDYAAKNEEIGEVSESSDDVGDGPGRPRHLTMKIAASEVKDVVDCGPLRSPDRAPARARSQHRPGLMQDALPDGDISVEQNVSGAFSGAGKDTTVDPLASDVRTQSKQWARLGARPRDRPPVKMAPPPESSKINLVLQEVAKPMAGGLVNAFLARHSQDQSLHESLCQGSAVKLLSDETSLQGASFVDGAINLSEPNKSKPYFGDCQVVSRPDVDSRWMFPPPETGREYDSHNAVGGYAYHTQLNAQLNGHVGPLSSYLTDGTSNFPSSSAFNSSNYNSFRSDFALGTREPHLPLYGQFDSGLNTSVAGNQRLLSGMPPSHLANCSLMGATGPPVHGFQSYGGPSDNALTVASEREKTQSAWKANSRLTSIGNMARADVGSSGLPAPLIATRSSGVDNRHVSEAESSSTARVDVGSSGLPAPLIVSRSNGADDRYVSEAESSNIARVDVGSSGLPAPLIASRSNVADDRYVSEAESSRTSQYALGTGGRNVLNTSGDRAVAGANRDVDNTQTEAALRSDEFGGSRLLGSANRDSNLEPRGADASSRCANTGGPMLNRDFGTDSVDSTDNSLLALEQRVEEACALVERVLREREEREQFGREIERKEREIREQRARKKREREAREQEEASRWPQQQEAITGRSQWLCEHYQRHCRVRFPCCTYFYPCHRCHNNSKACDKEDAKASHATHLKCSFCQHEQEIGEDSGKCRSCGAQMSAYFCSICKHFTSVDKNPYHCEKCGICRIHKDKSFHCEVCNVCLDKRLKGKHKCRPDSGHDECCICLEDAFSGCQILPCSHKVHRECAIAMIQNGIRTCPVCRHPLYSQASE